MFLECKQLFDIVGERIGIDYQLDLSEYQLFSGKPFHTPVTVKGFAENRAEIVSLNMDCSFTMQLDCDRCLNAFEREFHYCFSHTLVRELSAENDDMDDYIVVDGDQLDLDELVLSDILLSLPTKILCHEDCKGLCPVCGKDLNIGSCECKKKQVDPRLEKLGDLLK